MVTPQKRCPQCGEVRDLADFATDRSKANGRKSLCKPCDRLKSKRYYAANAERKRARYAERRRAERAT